MDIRWKQRFDNYTRALDNLERGLALGTWNDFERQGVTKAFELAYELAWKTLQDLLEDRDVVDATGPRAVWREALHLGWVADAELWARVHEGRNRAAYVYDQIKSAALFSDIREVFQPALRELWRTLEALL